VFIPTMKFRERPLSGNATVRNGSKADTQNMSAFGQERTSAHTLPSTFRKHIGSGLANCILVPTL
jgi:hypothetical protein